MKALERFAKKRFKRLKALLKAFPEEKEKEELHQIRLEIKKIKALLRLIHFNDKDFRDHKNFISLRTIFRETGKIRDIGIRKELLEQYTQIHTPFFRSSNRAVKQFLKAVSADIKAVKKRKKIVLNEIHKIKARTYSLYLSKKTKELTNLISEGIKQKDMHSLRKLIKEIIYLTSVTKKKSKINAFLLESAELIGKWHDKKILIPWIRTHAPNEKDTLKRLQAESNMDIQNLRKMIGERGKKLKVERIHQQVPHWK